MTKEELSAAVKAAKAQTTQALQTVVDALNKGQRKNLLKEDTVAQLLRLYGVQMGEDPQ